MKALWFLLLAAVVLLGPAATSIHAQPDTLIVPDDHIEISAAMPYASAGDLILVKEAVGGGPYSDYFTISSGVQVKAASGEEPVVDGGSLSSYTVDFENGASSTTLLEGITIKGGNTAAVRVRGNGVVRTCTIDETSAPAHYRGVVSDGSTIIDGCSITVSGATDHYGIWHSGGEPGITGCEIDLSVGTGIMIETPSPTTTGSVSGGTITLDTGWGLYLKDGSYIVEDCAIVFDTSDEDNVGIIAGYTGTNPTRCTIKDCLLQSPYAYYAGTGVEVNEDSVKVEGLTVDNFGIGISGFSGIDVDVHNCIVTGGYNYHVGFQGVNAVYCIADAYTPFDTGTQGTGSTSEDPLYCDATNGEYTLRVDSYGNPENNASGKRIGAYDVACMYGTLVRDATYAGDGTLVMPGTTTIPSGTTLTIEEGTTVKVAQGATNKLIVSGTLDVNGVSGNTVVFESAEASPSEGDWHSIFTGQGSEAFLDYVEIRDATYGVYMNTPDSVIVSTCRLARNSNVDIVVYGVSSGKSALIYGNDIDIAGGDGIALYGDCTGTTIRANDIYGQNTTGNGIMTQAWFSGSPTIDSNTIETCDNGASVYIDAGTVTLTENECAGSKYGVRVTGGTVFVGTTSSDSDNLIHSNSTCGVQCDGGSPVVRNNHIYSNYDGVCALNGGAPNLGDGTTYGYNSIYSNTRYCVNNQTASTLMARGNWWGSCSAPACTTGSVDVTGWLCSQPATRDRVALEAVGDATQLKMLGARPNPTRGASVIAFDLEEGSARIGVRVFDVSGRLVRSLGPAEILAGRHEIHWDGRDNAGRTVTDGIYFVRVQANNNLHGTTKVLVVR